MQNGISIMRESILLLNLESSKAFFFFFLKKLFFNFFNLGDFSNQVENKNIYDTSFSVKKFQVKTIAAKSTCDIDNNETGTV